jgi:hypothetical protein
MPKPDNRGVNEALRKAGFVRVPQLWLKRHEAESIVGILHRMAHNHQDEVKAIRAKCRREAKDE